MTKIYPLSKRRLRFALMVLSFEAVILAPFMAGCASTDVALRDDYSSPAYVPRDPLREAEGATLPKDVRYVAESRNSSEEAQEYYDRKQQSDFVEHLDRTLKEKRRE